MKQSVFKLYNYEICFQALVQFSDAETASSARTALDGRSIPRYALVECMSALSCM